MDTTQVWVGGEGGGLVGHHLYGSMGPTQALPHKVTWTPSSDPRNTSPAARGAVKNFERSSAAI